MNKRGQGGGSGFTLVEMLLAIAALVGLVIAGYFILKGSSSTTTNLTPNSLDSVSSGCNLASGIGEDAWCNQAREISSITAKNKAVTFFTTCNSLCNAQAGTVVYNKQITTGQTPYLDLSGGSFQLDQQTADRLKSGFTAKCSNVPACTQSAAQTTTQCVADGKTINPTACACQATTCPANQYCVSSVCSASPIVACTGTDGKTKASIACMCNAITCNPGDYCSTATTQCSQNPIA